MKSKFKILLALSATLLMFADSSFAQRRGMNKQLKAERQSQQLVQVTRTLKQSINYYAHPRAQAAQRAKRIVQNMVRNARNIKQAVINQGVRAQAPKNRLGNLRFKMTNLRNTISGKPLMRKVRPEVRQVQMKMQNLNETLMSSRHGGYTDGRRDRRGRGGN